MMGEELVQIPRCPHCGGTHVYKLAVERAFVVRMITRLGMNEPSRSVRCTRLFVCPVKKQQFQAGFQLQDTESSRIKGVDVVGLAEVEDV